MTGASVLALIDAAPAFVDAQPLAGAALRRAGLAALDEALGDLRAAEGDARHAALEAAAIAVGAIVGAEAVNETFAKAALEGAALEAGLTRELGSKQVKAAIAAGMKLGKRTPREFSRAAFGAEAMQSAAEQRGGIADKGAEQWQSRPPGAADRMSLSPAQPADDSTLEASSSPSSSPPRPPGSEASESQTLEDDDEDEDDIVDDDGEDVPPDTNIDPEVFRYCAGLDQSDVDNALRLLAYFGHDLIVREEEEVEGGQILAWTGTHWELGAGRAVARRIAQRVGNLIKLEADYIEHTPSEARKVKAGEDAAKALKTLDAHSDDPEVLARISALEDVLDAAEAAKSALYKRRSTRRKWGVTSKSRAKISAMLDEAAPHMRRHPDKFNADPLKVSTLTHTLSFVPVVDADNPDPDGERPLVDGETGRVQYRCVATKGHDRNDYLTAVIPFAYEPKATRPHFEKFLDLFQPQPEKRRTVQQYSGMSLTAQPVQRIMFHTGTGGNGKSVYLEVLSRVLGDGLAVGLPAESVSGDVQNNPSAPTPDIARCYAKRYLRVAELPKDAPLKQETIKKLTGGERWPVRTMYKGYFEFKPTAKPHMSGNGEPKFDGSDGGMKRRLIIVPWSVTLPTDKHRDFEEVVAEIAAEGAGILNWLIEGAVDFLNSGLVIAEEVLQATAEHFAEMDPVEQYIKAHVAADPGGPGVKATPLYQGFEIWCQGHGISPVMSNTRFGRIAKTKLERDDSGQARVYINIKLVNLPDKDAPPQNEPIGGWDRVPPGEMEI
ncbi:phage/plasmid primase, P4 family [Bradyrhizobium sp. SZCCHNRI1003]|uniref:DNA primase family protein n=1 Tax=Bradyrhizobium sp. SZCCHNRI1003 TaxID=3057275 RepID=UPI0029167355|nr:phage/plasmid primase, P4 family [Bradyrhizobium sp. SZCCHNRI1003]